MQHLLYFVLLCSTTCIASTPSFDHTAESYIQRAEACKNQQQFKEAFEWYKNALALKPNDFMLAFNIANLLYQHDLKEEAIIYYDKAIAIHPHVEQAYFNKGIVLTQLRRHQDAADCFMQAININPNYEKAYVHAGHALHICNRLEEACQIYKRGIERFPDNAELHYRYGISLKDQDLFEEGIAELRTSKELNPTHKVYALELANALHLIDASQEALHLYESLLEDNPNNHHLLYNFGYTLKKLGYIKQAIEVYDRVLECDPDYSLARFSRSLSYLTLGDFEQGWREYEWRWAAYDESPKKADCPVWNGCNPQGMRLLLYAEQGLGDTIQFVRYAAELKKRGAYIVVETQSALKQILQLCPYIDEVYQRGEPLPTCDAQAALMSLPLLCGTRMETIPHPVPYLYTDPTLEAYWQERLSADTNFKIGICWQGNPHYRTQALRQAVAGKSMQVTAFAPLAALEGVTLYSLQKAGGEAQLKELGDLMQIVDFGDELDTAHGRFMDTLAIMKQMDLIISVDTGTCHIAGALGVPIWNLLPTPADWRWMTDCTNTPWYENMRLFRQPTPGDWSGSIAECKKALMHILNGTKTVMQVTREAGDLPHFPEPITTPDYDDQALEDTCVPVSRQQVRTIATDAFNFDTLGNTQEEKTVPVVTTPADVLAYKKAKKDACDLTKQLIALNQQLWRYEQELKEREGRSLFDEEHMQFLQEIVGCYQRKLYIKRHIKQIAKEQCNASHTEA